MKNKKFILTLAISVLLVLGITYSAISLINKQSFSTESIAIKPLSSEISADGSIHSENEATLHFQTGGKLISLPVKEGDQVFQGQMIGQLDTYPLQKQLTAALNNYRSTRDTFDQNQANSQTGVLQGGQKYTLDVQNKVGVSGQQQVDIINDMAKRILDQNQTTLDNSVINVELANYAMQLATLTSPINGVITHEDVTVPNVNITPATSFSVADPNALIFKADVSPTDIQFINVGSKAKIKMDGVDQTLEGSVSKISPQKITLSNGQDAYEVDVVSDQLKSNGKLGAAGKVLIETNITEASIIVPTWVILGHNYIWVLEKNKPVLKKVTIGKTYDGQTEITSGLSKQDEILLNPKSIIEKNYKLL